MTKIKTNWKDYPLIIALCNVIFIIVPLFSVQTNWLNSQVVVGYLLASIVFIFITCDVFLGIYITFNDTHIYRTTEFFFKQEISFKDIIEVIYSPTWIIKDGNMTLSLIRKTNKGYKVTRLMTNGFYKSKDLNLVLNALKKKAPQAKFTLQNTSIHVNKESE